MFGHFWNQNSKCERITKNAENVTRRYAYVLRPIQPLIKMHGYTKMHLKCSTNPLAPVLNCTVGCVQYTTIG